MNLTPRLVAKLLTQSYSLPGLGQRGDATALPVGEARTRARWARTRTSSGSIRSSPSSRSANGGTSAGSSLPARNSDLARQLWTYVLADPEAKAWLDGEPDEWGMKVNPIYATTAAANPNGAAFADPVPDSFPKADPYCHQEPTPRERRHAAAAVRDRLAALRAGLNEAAVLTRVGDDRAKINLSPFALSSDQVWKRGVPQPLGERAILSLTDTASAARYGLQTARLSRAGDDGDERSFVAADSEGLDAAIGAMKPSSEPAVLVPDPAATAAGAYPLTMLTYAAVKPLELDTTARSEYAAFLEYAAGDGQVPGLEPGQLPVGYAALPESLKAQTLEAATLIRTMQAPVEPAEHRVAVTWLRRASFPASSGSSGSGSTSGHHDHGAAPRSRPSWPPPRPRSPRPPMPARSPRSWPWPAVGTSSSLSRSSPWGRRSWPSRSPSGRAAAPRRSRRTRHERLAPCRDAVRWLAALAVASDGCRRSARPRRLSRSPSTTPRPGKAGSATATIVVGGSDDETVARGGSATEFSLALPDGAACPGDSATGNWRVQSFLVPAADDPGTFTYESTEARRRRALGPLPARHPQLHQQADGHRRRRGWRGRSSTSAPLHLRPLPPGHPARRHLQAGHRLHLVERDLPLLGHRDRHHQHERPMSRPSCVWELADPSSVSSSSSTSIAGGVLVGLVVALALGVVAVIVIRGRRSRSITSS